MNTAFYTLGCKLNQSESEALASSFRSRGFSVVPTSSEASIYIINSCTVTSMAEQKARRMIRKFSSAHPESVVIVTGCYAQLDPEELDALGTNVAITGMEGKSRLLDLPEFLQHHDLSGIPMIQLVRDFFNMKGSDESVDRFRFNASHYSYHSRAFVKIQDGCNNRCSYCRVPLARGNAVSLELDPSLERIRSVLEGGYREVVLTGVNISAWRGKGNSGGLGDLIVAAADLAGEYGARIRLSSLEPDRLDARLLEALSHPAVAPHFHLPLQSMSQSVLSRMNRHYRIDEVMEWIARVRESVCNPFMAADIITGFDGESESEFEEGFEIMKQLDFAHLHVFPFSPREGTASEKPLRPVPERIRDERAKLYRELSASSYQTYCEANEGRKCGFLVEGIKEAEEMISARGLTDNYLRGELKLGVDEAASIKLEKKKIIPVTYRLGADGPEFKLDNSAKE